MPATLPLPGRIEESFRQRVARLPPETRRLLLIAAAEPVGDPALLWRAAATLGIGIDAAAPAETDGLLALGRAGQVPPPARALGRLRGRVDGRAAEGARCAGGGDRFGGRPRPPRVAPRPRGRRARRGGRRRSSSARPTARRHGEVWPPPPPSSSGPPRLTPEPARRAERALSAAQAKQEAGAPDSSLELLAVAAAGPLDELQRARMERLRARLAFDQRRGNDAPALLLEAARRLEPLDPALALETYLEALATALSTGHLDAVREVADALHAAPRSAPPGPVELLITALALLDHRRLLGG